MPTLLDRKINELLLLTEEDERIAEALIEAASYQGASKVTGKSVVALRSWTLGKRMIDMAARNYSSRIAGFQKQLPKKKRYFRSD